MVINFLKIIVSMEDALLDYMFLKKVKFMRVALKMVRSVCGRTQSAKLMVYGSVRTLVQIPKAKCYSFTLFFILFLIFNLTILIFCLFY